MRGCICQLLRFMLLQVAGCIVRRQSQAEASLDSIECSPLVLSRVRGSDWLTPDFLSHSLKLRRPFGWVPRTLGQSEVPFLAPCSEDPIPFAD